MPSSAILDVAIGIAFVYLFLSLICSVVNEGIAAVLSLRSKNLVAGIDSLLSGSKLQDNRPIVELLYSHGLIRGLYKDPPKEVIAKARAASPIGKIQNQAEALTGKAVALGNLLHVPVLGMVRQWFFVNLPAYIPSQVFATALIDIISPADPTRARDLNDVREAIDKLPPGPVRQALMSLVADTQKDLSEFQVKVEGWFNDSMDRASGWYKHRAQNILLCIALVLTVLLNVDTIKLAQSLWSNPVERQATVDLAQKYVDQNKALLQNQEQLKQQAGDLANLGQTNAVPLWLAREATHAAALLAGNADGLADYDAGVVAGGAVLVRHPEQVHGGAVNGEAEGEERDRAGVRTRKGFVAGPVSSNQIDRDSFRTQVEIFRRIHCTNAAPSARTCSRREEVTCHDAPVPRTLQVIANRHLVGSSIRQHSRPATAGRVRRLQWPVIRIERCNYGRKIASEPGSHCGGSGTL